MICVSASRVQLPIWEEEQPGRVPEPGPIPGPEPMPEPWPMPEPASEPEPNPTRWPEPDPGSEPEPEPGPVPKLSIDAKCLRFPEAFRLTCRVRSLVFGAVGGSQHLSPQPSELHVEARRLGPPDATQSGSARSTGRCGDPR